MNNISIDIRSIYVQLFCNNCIFFDDDCDLRIGSQYTVLFLKDLSDFGN